MATYFETKIYNALIGKLVALTLSPSLSVAYPNVPFTPPEDGYLRVSHFPNLVQQITVGDTGINRYTGILQIDLFSPENEGIVGASEVAGEIAQHFKRGTFIDSDGAVVRVISPPIIATGLSSPPYLQTPISIRWQADVAN